MQVFICGTGRSGTSIFNKVIGLHRDIWSFRWESQIFSGLPALCDLLDSKNQKQLVNKFSDRVSDHLYKRNVGGRYDAGLFEIVSEEQLADAIGQLKKSLLLATSLEARAESCRRFSNSIFEVSAGNDGKKIWVEKTPRNLLYADEIKKIYPNAKFINLIRDGRDVVSSIMEKQFWPIAKSNRFGSTRSFGGDISFEKAVDYWVSLMDVTDIMRKSIGPESWLDIRLEDLGHSLEATLKETEHFLNVASDPEFLSKAQKLVRPKRADSNRFESDLTDSQMTYLMERQFDHLKKYKYV